MTLTEKDVDTIEKIVEERLESKFPNLMKKINKILEILSDFSVRLKNMEDEQTVHNKQATGYEKRVENLENIHPQGQHSS